VVSLGEAPQYHHLYIGGKPESRELIFIKCVVDCTTDFWVQSEITATVGPSGFHDCHFIFFFLRFRISSVDVQFW